MLPSNPLPLPSLPLSLSVQFALLSSSQEVRAGGLRVLRCILVSKEIFQLMLDHCIDQLVVRCEQSMTSKDLLPIACQTTKLIFMTLPRVLSRNSFFGGKYALGIGGWGNSPQENVSVHPSEHIYSSVFTGRQEFVLCYYFVLQLRKIWRGSLSVWGRSFHPPSLSYPLSFQPFLPSSLPLLPFLPHFLLLSPPLQKH